MTAPSFRQQHRECCFVPVRGTFPKLGKTHRKPVNSRPLCNQWFTSDIQSLFYKPNISNCCRSLYRLITNISTLPTHKPLAQSFFLIKCHKSFDLCISSICKGWKQSSMCYPELCWGVKTILVVLLWFITLSYFASVSECQIILRTFPS